MNRVLITGATGFVGRHLCAALVQRQFVVRAAVREWSSRHGLPPEVEPWSVGDIAAKTCWEDGVLDGVDFVVHLAARVHVRPAITDDGDTNFRATNVAATERLALAAVGRVRCLVFVSSLHAVRSLADEVLNEASPCQPSSAYGRSKLAAEQRLQEINRDTGLPVTIVRPPAVYGPGGVGSLMTLLRWIRRGWPLPLGGLASRRSLIYVGNLADALVACVTQSQASGHTFLVSDGAPLTISDLVRRAAAAFHRPARLCPAPVGLLRCAGRLIGQAPAVERLLGSLAVDIGCIRRTLGWIPPFSVNEGLRETARWLTASSTKGVAQDW
ncbi:MAG: NAD-dependent epimerase/dehydratase family protein [Planctomycetota bacterium]|nr:NAD-dependent epimerase/dehydratase family protein [Planctomycetota bacterium]